jgi:hypothetical protein
MGVFISYSGELTASKKSLEDLISEMSKVKYLHLKLSSAQELVLSTCFLALFALFILVLLSASCNLALFFSFFSAAPCLEMP